VATTPTAPTAVTLRLVLTADTRRVLTVAMADIRAAIMVATDLLAGHTTEHHRMVRPEDMAVSLLRIVRAAAPTAVPVAVSMVAEDHMEEEAVVPMEEVGTAKRG
jgi:hypothetical protein